MKSFFSKCIVIYLSLSVNNAITPMVDLEAACLMITEAEAQYERVDQRLQADTKNFSTILNRGLHNNTLLAEIQRDSVYIELSYPLMVQLSNIKACLKQIIFRNLTLNDDHYEKVLFKIQRLLNKHSLVTDQTLLRFIKSH